VRNRRPSIKRGEKKNMEKGKANKDKYGEKW
jgi:hypothetical protein